MINLFKPRTKVVRDEIAQKVCDILFPPHVEKEEDGQTYIVDYSVDNNLMGALVDLEHGSNDEVTRETILAVITKLGEARELLMANYPITKKARYLLVDAPPQDPIEKRVSPSRD